jgi:L-fuconolactonase
MDQPFIDAHVHFWDPARLSYPWLDRLPAIAGAHLPANLRRDAGEHVPHSVVFVQAECDRAQAFDEVSWVESLAETNPDIAAIVAFAPMDQGEHTALALARLQRKPLVRGIRHLIQDDRDPDLCRRAAFIAGVRTVGASGLSFEICLRHGQLRAAVELVRSCPETSFVLDHAGKPDVRGARLDPWRADIAELATFPRVACKLSGLVTEADTASWRIEHLRPYVDHLLGCFGPWRLLFGSDWPVVKLASSYDRWRDTARALLGHLSPANLDAVFLGNARRIYRLSRPRSGGATTS